MATSFFIWPFLYHVICLQLIVVEVIVWSSLDFIDEEFSWWLLSNKFIFILLLHLYCVCIPGLWTAFVLDFNRSLLLVFSILPFLYFLLQLDKFVTDMLDNGVKNYHDSSTSQVLMDNVQEDVSWQTLIFILHVSTLSAWLFFYLDSWLMK